MNLEKWEKTLKVSFRMDDTVPEIPEGHSLRVGTLTCVRAPLPTDEQLADVAILLSTFGARPVYMPRRGQGRRVIVTRDGWEYTRRTSDD